MKYASRSYLRRPRNRKGLGVKFDPTKVVALSIGGIVFMFLASLVVFAIMSRDLPEPGKVSQKGQFSTVFYDRDGEILFEMYKDKNRIWEGFRGK